MNIDFLALGALGAAIILIGALVFLRKKNVDFGLRTIIALIFGLGLGIGFAGHTNYVQLIGTVYANVISAFVVPLLFFSVISSVAQLENIHKLKKIGVKSIGLLTPTTFIAATVTIIVSLAFGIGKNALITLPTD